MMHLSNKQLTYYTGNYDQFCQTRAEQEEEQMRKYAWEQDQIKQMKVRTSPIKRRRPRLLSLQNQLPTHTPLVPPR